MNKKPSVLIIGLGLIGGSFAKALKTRGLAEVYGYNRAEGVAQTAVELGIVDHAVTQLDQLEAVDVIVLAVPVMAIGAVMNQVAHLIPKATLLTDVGSVKGEVVTAVEQAYGSLPSCFVPGHPIAGAEKSGVYASNAELFVNHMHILTPLSGSTPEAVALAELLWRGCGAEVEQMSVQRHDEVLAATSHLPHLLAFSLVDTLSRESENREIFKYAAGGFRDFSRIAASDPTMWHDIFLSNSEATLSILRRFQADLSVLEQAIADGDGELLHRVFSQAKSSRDHFAEILERRQNKTE